MGRNPSLTKKLDIVKFLLANPSWYLEQRQGATRDSEWWQVRNAMETDKRIHCNGNAAKAAIKLLTRHDTAVGSSLNETKWSGWPMIEGVKS